VLLDTVAEHGGELETIVPSSADDLVGLYRDSGWVQAREILRMELDVTQEPQPPVWPDGVAVRTYRDDDAPAVHTLMVEAFAASAEVVLPFDRWVPWMTGDPGFDPGVWFLAEAGTELCGACLCWAEGWVKDVGVHPAWRGRGLGEALLREAFGEFHRRGLATVGLKVDSDNPTGAVRLYERALDAIAVDHPRPDELLDFCRAENERIEAFVAERDQYLHHLLRGCQAARAEGQHHVAKLAHG